MPAPGLPTRRYSIDELLNLRERLPVVRCLVNNLNRADVTSVLRIPEEAFHDPAHFFCTTKALAEIFNQYKANLNSRKYTSESSEESGCQSVANTITDNHLTQPQIHWNLRRRESSDRSGEPRSAPSGIAAQKAENFQKFYRAVISPTHIRVTAGGRIVPNNRSSGLPGVEKNNNETYSAETIALEPASLNFHSRPWPNPQHLPSGCTKLVPAGIWPSSNFPQPGGSFIFPPLAPHLQVYPTDKLNPAGRCRAPNLEGNMAFGSQQTTPPESIKISHPSQFDYTKPFMISGQVVYPVQSGFQPSFQPSPYAFPVPIGIIGNSNFISQGQPPGFQKPHPVASAGNSNSQAPFTNVSSHSMSPPNHGYSSDFAVPPNFIPATGIPIPAKDFLTGQLQALYTSLSSIEKQISGKNPQYDQGLLEAQRNMIQSQINSTKNALSNQIYRQSSKNKDHDFKDKKMQAMAIPAIVSDENKARLHHRIPPLAPVKGVESTRTNSTENTNYTDKAAQSKSPIKSRLSMSSAKAPPFQPRPQIKIDALWSTENIQTTQAKDSANFEVNSGDSIPGSRKLHYFPNPCNGYLTPDWPPLVPSTKFEDTHRLQSNIVQSTQRSSTYSFPSNNFNRKLPASKSLGAPYLVGTVPSDLKCNPNMSANVTYSRPLTNEEIRARYLYFGRAPRSIQSGLPKFDGKDFYPPSPSKNMERLHSSKSDSETMVEYSSTAPNFELRCKAPAVSGFVTPSPIRYRHSLQNLQRVSQSSLDPSITKKKSQSSLSCSSRQEELDGQQNNSPKNNNSSNNDVNSPHKFAHSDTNNNMPRFDSISLENSMGDMIAAENFSRIFSEHGLLSHGPQSRKLKTFNNINFGDQHDLPVISPKPMSPEDHPDRKNHVSYDQHSTYDEQALQNNFHIESPISGVTEDHSTDSTVEIRLSPRFKVMSSKLAEKTLSDRIENFRSADQQTLFLQNMLKNPPLAPLMGSALSGAITSTPAWGYLPQYQGSAVASLAPSKLSSHVTKMSTCETEDTGNIKYDKHSLPNLSPTNASKITTENIPFTPTEAGEFVSCSDGLGVENGEHPLS
ncbi:hypothetical protein K3495_g7804 [Podosphaera aphanis]|nr:hypothetical protein K3495_g7804 [Podosphaera aphanis]